MQRVPEEVMAQARRALGFAAAELRRFGLPRADREDIQQDVALAIIRRGDAFTSPEEEQAYIGRATFIKVCLRSRAERRSIFSLRAPPRASREGDSSDESVDEEWIDPASVRASTEDRVASRDLLRKLRPCLSDNEYHAIFEYLVEDHTAAEIAAALGVSRSRVENWIRSAKRKLRRALAEKKNLGAAVPAGLAAFFKLEQLDGHAQSGLFERAWHHLVEVLSEAPWSRALRTAAGAECADLPANRKSPRHNRPPRLRTLAGVLLALFLTSTLVSRHRELIPLGLLGEAPRALAAALASSAPGPAIIVAERAAVDTVVGVALGAPPIAPRSGPRRSVRTARPTDPAMRASKVEGAPDPDDSTLIVRARGALDDDDYATCLRLLDEHRARFPHGRFAPEREAFRAEVSDQQARRQGRLDVNEAPRVGP